MIELNDIEQKVLRNIEGCIACQAADENGRLSGTMTVEISFNGFSTDVNVIKPGVFKESYDEDELDTDYYDNGYD